MMDAVNLNGITNGGNGNSDDEVLVGNDEELAESKDLINDTTCRCITARCRCPRRITRCSLDGARKDSKHVSFWGNTVGFFSSCS